MHFDREISTIFNRRNLLCREHIVMTTKKTPVLCRKMAWESLESVFMVRGRDKNKKAL